MINGIKVNGFQNANWTHYYRIVKKKWFKLSEECRI